jgi:hypothetical protein
MLDFESGVFFPSAYSVMNRLATEAKVFSAASARAGQTPASGGPSLLLIRHHQLRSPPIASQGSSSHLSEPGQPELAGALIRSNLSTAEAIRQLLLRSPEPSLKYLAHERG